MGSSTVSCYINATPASDERQTDLLEGEKPHIDEESAASGGTRRPARDDGLNFGPEVFFDKRTSPG
jgi:hypothetical protein